MGYNTTVVVMNDSLSAIEQDPEFGKRLVAAILKVQRGQPVDVAAHGKHMLCCNAATVIESHHADHSALVKVGRNYGEVLEVESWKKVESGLRKTKPTSSNL